MAAARKSKLLELFWRFHPWVYRKTGGRLLGTMLGMPVLLLMTKGRKTGQVHTSALMYVPQGDACVVVASYLGEPRHPAWWLNLRANPRATIQRGRTASPVVAREAEGEERARLWDEFVRRESGYATYAQRTSRRIPVVVLEP